MSKAGVHDVIGEHAGVLKTQLVIASIEQCGDLLLAQRLVRYMREPVLLGHDLRQSLRSHALSGRIDEIEGQTLRQDQ